MTKQSLHTACIASILLLVTAPQTSLGQVAVPRQPTTRIVIDEETSVRAAVVATAAAAQPASTQPAQSSQANNAQKRKAERLKQIQQLKFDRRPSTILKAWSMPPDAEQKKAEAQQAEDKEEKDQETNSDADSKPPGPPVPPFTEEQLEKKEFSETLAKLQRSVTLSQWVNVRTLLAALPEDEGKAAYQAMLQSLRSGSAAAAVPANLPPGTVVSSSSRRRIPERSVFATDDVFAIAAAAPHDLEKEHLSSLGSILQAAIKTGSVIENFVERLKAEVDKPEDQVILTRRQAAQLLFAAGFPIPAGDFLPDLEQAVADKDHEALNLLSRYHLAQYGKEQKVTLLEEAWRVTQAVLAAEDVDTSEREESLKRAVELAPRVREELGQAWLEASFTDRPLRGMEILAAIGSQSSQGLQNNPTNADFRLKALQLQTTAVEALLKASSDRAADWRETLNLLAGNWLTEANLSYSNDTSTSLGPSLRRDSFGNFYYYNVNESGSSRSTSSRARAIATGELLEIKPSDEWLRLVFDGRRPEFDKTFAQLYLKVGEEKKAYPFIESLAKTYPEKARKLVDEFLQVWTRNHDPNATRNRTNYYMYMYGYERKAESIPLTRSKQERNLLELAELVKRLEALPLGELNEELLARAFMTCHSSAEVYQLATMERVFGNIERIKPKTLAELTQQMRQNLRTVWRQPAVQKQNKTKRKQKDIESEVLRGYSAARAVVEDGLKKHPDEWSLQLVKAALSHDENNYLHEIEKSSAYAQRRKEALSQFAQAAQMYADNVADLSEEDQTTRAYELWYYASLGDCELGGIDQDKQPMLGEPAKIRTAIDALPGEAAEQHLTMFANTLFTRMSSVNPAVKFRYLRTGFEIVGDHKQAHEAKKVYDYYRDLVTEIKLDAQIDGSDTVGHGQPFGLFVNIRHTREIERESGGFGRYLQNQNNLYYSYNYGRPTENYRDKFEETVQQALGEQFEVLSVTFQSEDVNSRALEEYGWRMTPYAYVLLKARGPEVDKIPSVQLDLDFLDTSGYAVLPIESPTLPIDATAGKVAPRPVTDLQVTQTLDERQASEGKLIVEVKATAHGLVPELEDILEFESDAFEITEIEDEGVSISKFETESDKNEIVSERTWMVNMAAGEDLAALPETFQFGKPKTEIAETTYQRYVDADLLAVEPVVSLEAQYGETSRTWMWWLGGAVVGVVGLVVVTFLLAKRPPEQTDRRFQMPESLTPFTVLGLLRDIERNNGFSESGKQDLLSSINRIEQYYFSQPDAEEPDLQRIAETWLSKATAN